MEIRPLGPGDEESALRAHEELAAEDFEALLGWNGQPWPDYLAHLSDVEAGVGLPPGRVPAAFRVAVVDGSVAGRVSVRYALVGRLITHDGHIGYGVSPRFRRRGVATALLRHGLGLLAGRGVDRALVTCDDGNVGSARTIERCGGVYEGLVEDPPGPPVRRYWVPVDGA